VTGDPTAGSAAWAVDAVVFDLGGVLVEWDPRHLYRSMLGRDEDVEEFLDEVGFAEWNSTVDAGDWTWAEAVEDLTARHPHRRELIAAYPARFTETLAGPIEGSVEVLRELHRAGVRLVALTNWSVELFPHARERFDFLELFEGIVVSGEERLAKPDRRIFELLLDRHRLDPARTVFVDDREDNVAAARAAGMRGLVFRDPDTLRSDLAGLGLLPQGR
jgi:2-haloacid dehalogenase